jgi:transposase
MTQPNQYVGIDVCKKYLDVYIRPKGEYFRTGNDLAGIMQIQNQLTELNVECIVLEATGGMEQLAARTLAQKGLPVAIVNPKQVRNFARASSKLAKTDKIDAQTLAHFAQAIQPEIRAMSSDSEQELKDLVSRRRQIVEMITAEKSRLNSSRGKVQTGVEEHIEWLKQKQKELEAAIDEVTAQNQAWQTQINRLESVPGIGAVVARTLVADLPELGKLTHKQIASLVGLAPFNRDSGMFRGKRMISGGRAAVRSTLYMAALVGIRHNSLLREFYEKLIQRGKLKKVALVACMHKLLTIINAMLRSGCDWQTAETTSNA